MIDGYFDPQLPIDLGEFGAVYGPQPWPQDWLAWRTTKQAFESMANAPSLSRASVLSVAAPVIFPPPQFYRSVDAQFPGIADQAPSPSGTGE